MMKITPIVLLSGNLDIEVEWRKQSWVCRPWGISLGDWFFGLITVKKVQPIVKPGSYKNARGVMKATESAGAND